MCLLLYAMQRGDNLMIESLILIIIAVSIIGILFFAFMTKTKVASYIAYTILAAVAVSMALTGMIGLINDIDFLAFLVSFFRFLKDIVVFIELGIIVFLLLISKHKTKITLLKVAVIVYAVLTLLLALNII